MEQLEVTAEHLTLIRNLRVVWIDMESGAPGVMALGKAAPDEKATVAEVQRILKQPELSSRKAMQRFSDALRATEIVVQLGELPPGHFTYPVWLTPDALAKQPYMQHHLARVEADQIAFDVTAEHLKLLRRANYGPAFVEEDEPPRVAMINGKRPYGDMTYFELDMGEILGVAPDGPFRTDHPQSREFTPAQLERLNSLHESMEPVLQIFLQHASLAPGHFTRPEDNGPWTRVGPR